MNKNKGSVETAKNSQPAQKDKTPTGKMKTLKSAKERKEAREKEYRNFRINAFKRRAKRMHIAEEEIPKLVEKLIAQLDAPKEYSILIMFNKNDGKMFHEALKKENIKYKFHGDDFFAIDGNESILAKIREIAPVSAKIHPYAKKAESILKAYEPKKEKKPTNNTPEVRKAAKKARKRLNKKVRALHKKGKGRSSKRYTRNVAKLKSKTTKCSIKKAA